MISQKHIIMPVKFSSQDMDNILLERGKEVWETIRDMRFCAKQFLFVLVLKALNDI